MMNWQRPVLLAGMFALSILLLARWGEFQQQRQERHVPPAADRADTVGERAPAAAAPLPPPASAAAAPHQLAASAAATTDGGEFIHVQTALLSLRISLRGGDILYVGLPRYPATLAEQDKAFALMDKTATRHYIARSGLVGPQGTDRSDGTRPLFDTADSRRSFTLAADEGALQVELLHRDPFGAAITKRFSFQRDSYLARIEYLVRNDGTAPWSAGLYGQFQRDGSPDPQAAGGSFQPAAFLGFALHTEDKPYHKIDLDELDKKSADFSLRDSWLALVQHYFISAWIPDSGITARYRLRRSQRASNLYLGSFTTPPILVLPGAIGAIGTSLYMGPKDADKLQEISEGLQYTVDYGWLFWLARPLFIVLVKLHQWTGNWGVAIILLTLIVKLLFFRLSSIGFRSMAKMRELQPRMEELRRLHSEDKQKLSQEMMALYKREKINPMGGCLPILVQMPVFLALYWVLLESVELRHAPFIFWIADLASKDPYYILPLLMGASMVLQQRLGPQPPDANMAFMMRWMPVVFTIFFLFFPSGLVLYWLSNNLLSILQQSWLNHQIKKEGKHAVR